jgi:tetratricopeptide (TPR) repeat protein
MGEFDDFFELDDSASGEKEKKEERPAADQAVKTPAPKPPATDDKLLGDFDSLFEEAEKAPTKIVTPPAKPAVAKAPPKAESGSVDDLFDGFPVEEAKPQPSAPKPAAPSPAPRKPAPPSEPADLVSSGSRSDEGLEDLFAEVSGQKDIGAVGEEAAPADALESGLGIEYKERRFQIPKAAKIAVPAVIGVVALAALLMARFTTSGFFGWTFGQKPADGYEPPSSRVLAKLNKRSAEASGLLVSDTVEGYQKAITEFEEILKVDPRHSPTDARLAEAILLVRDRSYDTDSRRKVAALLVQSDKYHPGIIETVRGKARDAFSSGKLAEADSLARRALTLDPKDVDTITLLGELAVARGEWEGAAQEFARAVEANPVSPRAKYYLAVVSLQQGKIDTAEELLRGLAGGTPPHPRSEVELFRLSYANRGKVEEARQGLEALLREKADKLSNYDLGRSYRYLAEISEAKGDVAAAIGFMEKAIEKDPINHVNGFHLAKLYLGRKEYEKAAQQFGRVSSLSPDTAEYLIYLGHALREAGKAEEALVELTKGVEKAPGNVEGLYQLGVTQRKLGRLDESITSLESALKNDARHLDSMIALGELYAEKDNFNMAQTQLRTALAIAPKSVRAHNAMGEVLLAIRRWDEALSEFKTAEGEDVKNVAVLANLGKAYLVLGNVDLASSYFQRALDIDPTRADTQVALGQLQHQKKEFTKALETYRKVLEMRPKDYDTRVKVAQVLIDQNAFQEAIAELQEASKYKPGYFPTKLALGIAWRGVGDLESSLESLNSAISIRPEAAEAYYELGTTQIYRNDIVNAEKAMENAAKFDPKFIEPLVALGDFYASRNIFPNAAEFYERARKIQPRNSAILMKLADTYRNDEKPKLAKKYFEEAIRIDKKASDAYVGLGLLAEENRQSAVAMKYYRAAQGADPDNPKPYKLMGFMYREMNQKNAAILSFRKYLKLDPQSKEREDIEEVVRKLESE